MGTAEVQTSRCWAWLGMACQKCVDVCPSKHVAIVLDAERRPVVNADACTGCGACEQACPENPTAIRVIAK
jgi:ferredoxin-type protein NapG